ncbi:MAG: hypothetical protein AMJ69_00590 [Gammaproteobacteria bacterium SG8_47]|nr:MAG: hypothetical protein AMJ69_00590 [Gammaproteobacteria bacterium SG8_47]
MAESSSSDKLVQAYHQMLERLKGSWRKAEAEALPAIRESIAHAQDKASELGELTREEAENIADYLRRDLRHAGEHLSENTNELAAWLQFDLKLVEQRLVDLFSTYVDQSRVELGDFEERLATWHSGEITGAGVLECTQCGTRLKMTKPGRVPSCPKCHGKTYRKLYA